MKRLLVLVLLLACSASAAAPEKWWDAYDRGVAAVNAKNYKLAAESLQKAIAEMPNEGLNVRARKSLITYVPHFFLGIAKYNLGDPDGALREWKTCEDQGVLARTEYYAGMKDWIARAQTEKQRNAHSAATGPKNAASTALTKALRTQVAALSAGGDRTDSYAGANRKLQDANAQFQKAGSDINAYKAAEQAANQATALFLAAADEGKKLKLARAAAPPPKKAAPPVQQAQVIVPAPIPAPVKLETPPLPVATKEAPAQMTPVLTKAEMEKQIAEQEAKLQKLAKTKKTEEPAARAPQPAPAPAPVSAPAAKLDLRPAYRAFAAGNLAAAEHLLDSIVKSQPAAAEAYLLRGCARYTRAMLTRQPESLLMKATDDFRAALDRNRNLRLDRAAFSPKLVSFFDDVRRKRR